MGLPINDLISALNDIKTAHDGVTFHKNLVGNLLIVVDDTYIGWIDLRNAEVNYY